MRQRYSSGGPGAIGRTFRAGEGSWTVFRQKEHLEYVARGQT